MSSGESSAAAADDRRINPGIAAFKSPTIGQIAVNKLVEDKTDLVFKAKRANVYTEGMTLDPDDPFVIKQYEMYPKESIQAELIREKITTYNCVLGWSDI
jgi:hypothetical protein